MGSAVIPRIIHLVWLGETVEPVCTAVDDHRRLNPQHTVILHTDDHELNPAYRETYDKYARLPQLQSDLIRWSVLEKYGGWYFDIDIVPLVGVEQIERTRGQNNFYILGGCEQRHLAVLGEILLMVCRSRLSFVWYYQEIGVEQMEDWDGC